jgi:vitamin B12 transporter
MLLSVVALGTAAAPARGQAGPGAEDAALRACRQAVEAKQENEARTLTARAEAEYRRVLTERPRDVGARVLLARVLTQCKRPHVSFMAQGRVIGQANELLEEALAIDSTHWAARFTLAMNHFHAPEFLGRTSDAIREFERLLEQQADRADGPWYADTYLYLGDLYLRRKRASDAVAVWRRGAALFPQHAGLRERLQAHAGTASPPPAGAAQVEPSAAQPTYALHEIVVAASGSRIDDPRSGVALRRLDVLLTPGGAADLMQALRTGPGTTGAAEGSDLYVRGGDPAEAPVWVDGARLFYPGRYESLNGAVFGILDPAVMKSAFFSSGGFSARYGNALSGVLDVRTEERPTVRTGQVALNSVQAGATLQLPLGEALGAWGTVRATDATAMLAMHGRGDDFRSAPRALEGMGALAWEPRSGTLLKATAMVDGDRSAREVDAYGYRGAFKTRGENRLLGLSGRMIGSGGRASLQGSLSASSRTSAFAFGVLDRERTDRGLTGRLDGDLELAPGRRLRGGIEAAELNARYGGTLPLTDQLAPSSAAEWREERETTSHLGGYVEAEIAPLPRLALVAGLRADRLPGEAEWTVDPRLAVGFRAADAWTLRLGGGVFHQGRWRTRYTLPNALSPSGIPRRATHLVAGAERQGEPALKVEAYMKDYDEYVLAGDGPPIASGRAAGADAIVRWSRQERLNGWLTYSLLRGRLELEDGREVPSAIDVTHTLTAVGTLRLPSGWQLGSTGRFATGRPFTRPGGEAHAERLPDYARLDARLTRFWPVRTGTLVTYLELLNALDRTNVTAYTFDTSGEQQAIPAFFRRTAVLGFSYSF